MKIEKGVPHLNSDQHSRYFNIVAIEFHLQQLNQLKISCVAVVKHIDRLEAKLAHITKDLEPADLFLELIELS
ncbi:hypothetical protein [Flavicella sediminum]|uniref:hypothetical protein n=1 Tax=Flavicella sediminum TaxID=2585141 RepID=UPI001AA051DB|nr:hypothetical protein [Flavicella sediminum]